MKPQKVQSLLRFFVGRRDFWSEFFASRGYPQPGRPSQKKLASASFSPIFSLLDKTEETMLREFKEFAMKGNMLDMAIGIVLGAAFGTVVKSLVDDVLMPLISALTGAPDFSNLFILLKAPEVTEGVNMESLQAIREAGGSALAYGQFINAIVAFLLVALALFFVVKAVNRLKREEEAAPAPPPEPPVEVQLLSEIRDLLKKG